MDKDHSALDVAYHLIALSQEEGKSIDHLQLQKLTYFCHALHLAMGKGPLFYDAVEAWQYGPVVRSVYHTFKGFGGGTITTDIEHTKGSGQFSAEEQTVMRHVWENFGSLPGIRLAQLTHAKGSPWDQVYSQNGRSQIIHNHLIRDYYRSALAKQEN